MFFAGILCLYFIPLALASLVNVTIDDKFGDPQTGTQITYFPLRAWNDGMAQPCSGCIAQPDPSQLYNTTWHDSTFDPQPGSGGNSGQMPSASVTFNGSAIYVYCAIPPSSSSPDGNSDMTFFIDGKMVGTFTQALTTGSRPNYQYYTPVYVNDSMSATLHTFMLQNGQKGDQKSLALLDSITYTYNDGKPPSTSSSSVSATHLHRTVLLGSLLSILLGLLFVGLGVYLYIRSRRRRRQIAPSQQYAANKFISKRFNEGGASTNLQPSIAHIILDLSSEMAPVRAPTPPKTMHSNSEGLRVFLALSSRTRLDGSSTVSASCPSPSQRETPLVPGRRNFIVVNQ